MAYLDGFYWPTHNVVSAYDGDDADERGFLSDTIDIHAWALIEALKTASTSDCGLNMDCAALAKVLEDGIMAIKQRGDF